MPQSYFAPNGKDRKGNARFKPDIKKFLYNIDTLWLNVDIFNYDDVMNKGLLNKLIKGREAYYEDDESNFIEIKIPGYDNLIRYEIMPGQKPIYGFSIRNEDIAIYFTKRYREDTLPLKVQINQFLLWSKGLEKAYFEALCVLTSLGFVPTRSVLNRVDFAVHSDQWQWNLKDLESFDYPRNIANDNHPNFFRLDPLSGDFETVYYGDRTRCQLRIYQKSIEAKKKKKDYFLKLYESFGMNKDKVWNVEIEVRREFIKSCTDFNGNKLFDDFEEVINENRLADLWSYLMNMYKHDSNFWTLLSHGDPSKRFYKVDGFELVRQKDIDSNFERELAQIAGRLKLAVINEEDYSLKNALKIFEKKYNEIEVKQRKKNFTKEVEKKKKSIHSEDINKKIHNKKTLIEKSLNVHINNNN